MAGLEVALALDVARRPDPGGNAGRRLAGRRRNHVGGAHRGHVDADVDAIEERARDAALIVGRAGVAALAGVARRARHATLAGVHRGDELEAGREGDARIGAGDHRLAALDRLAQAVEHRGRKFRQLVEE